MSGSPERNFQIKQITDEKGNAKTGIWHYKQPEAEALAQASSSGIFPPGAENLFNILLAWIQKS